MEYQKMKYLCLMALMVCMPVHAGTTLFDDFFNSVSMDRFRGMEKEIKVDTTDEKVEFSAGTRGYLSASIANNLTLIDDDTSFFQVDLTLLDASLSNPETQQALLGIAGVYYNAESANQSDSLGEVFVRVAIGDRGNGLEAWYELQVSSSDTWNTSAITTASFGTVELNRAYTASITYDGDNSFTIVFDHGAAVVVDGPPRAGSAFEPLRYLNNRIRLGQDNSTPDLSDSLPDVNEPVFIAGAVDNVVIDAGLVDDFSADDIDKGIWVQDQTKVAADSGSMLMKITSQGTQVTERFWVRKKGLNAIGATLTLMSSSTINDSTLVRGRLTHFLSNDTYDIENGGPANGQEGLIWTQFLIEREGGENRVVVYAERVKDADWSTWDELFWINLGPINLDQPYALLVEKSGTRVDYRLDGTLVHSFDLATDHAGVLSGNDYVPVGETESGLHVRVSGTAGMGVVRFDDVITDHSAPVLKLKVFDDTNAVVNYPPNAFVHEGEIVDLRAETGETPRVAAYVWEQLSGTGVLTASAKGSQRQMGNDQSLSFTVPPGSNLETLKFDLTVVDDAGVQASRSFELNVDNSAERSLARAPADTDSKSTKSSSSGGGATDPEVLILGLIVLLASARIRYGNRQ